MSPQHMAQRTNMAKSGFTRVIGPVWRLVYAVCIRRKRVEANLGWLHIPDSKETGHVCDKPKRRLQFVIKQS